MSIKHFDLRNVPNSEYLESKDIRKLPKVLPIRFCMFHGCEEGARTRGLCDKHYTHFKDMVRDGKATWQELEESGEVSRRLPRSEHECRDRHPPSEIALLYRGNKRKIECHLNRVRERILEGTL